MERDAEPRRDVVAAQPFDAWPHRRGDHEAEQEDRESTRNSHSATAPATTATATRVVTNALRAVSPIARVFSPGDESGKPVLTGPNERVCVDARRHGVVLARPFSRALPLAAAGAFLTLQGWPVTVVGAALLALGAGLALRAVWRWDRTRVVLTNEKLFVVHGVLRRHTAGVRLRAVDAVELEQSLAGRVLGYGTLTVGALEVTHVAQARRVAHLVERLSS